MKCSLNLALEENPQVIDLQVLLFHTARSHGLSDRNNAILPHCSSFDPIIQQQNH
jgi:hypothetical protein